MSTDRRTLPQVGVQLLVIAANKGLLIIDMIPAARRFAVPYGQIFRVHSIISLVYVVNALPSHLLRSTRPLRTLYSKGRRHWRLHQTDVHPHPDRPLKLKPRQRSYNRTPRSYVDHILVDPFLKPHFILSTSKNTRIHM